MDSVSRVIAAVNGFQSCRNDDVAVTEKRVLFSVVKHSSRHLSGTYLSFGLGRLRTKSRALHPYLELRAFRQERSRNGPGGRRTLGAKAL